MRNTSTDNPWCGLQAPEQDLKCLVQYVKDQCVDMMYEFGSGVSTQRLSEAGIIVTSFETHKEYSDAVVKYFKQLQLDPMPKIVHYIIGDDFTSYVKLLPKAKLCFVDGPKGCKKMSRIKSLEAATYLTDNILLHDAQRRGEQESLEYMVSKGWRLTYLPGAVKVKKIALLTK